MITYRGLQIKATQDFGLRQKGKVGCLISDGVCNVMPGGTWSHTVSGARKLIDAYIEAGGAVQNDGEDYTTFFCRSLKTKINAAKFWELVRA